ncbi:MAG: helix-turn-helix domain-containing protein [Nocardioides sp.]|uniref:TetR/AcrR family transcriptional regulator n=1 Tax=Nocardioides sp. TaxID=35761 RepID=UPI0039E42D97
MTTRPRPGRPRHGSDGDGGGSPREEILQAAAGLFVEHGFAGTSTRSIAERVGIRQASLYYHFAGKDEILVELLRTSVRPTLDIVRAIESADPPIPPAAALYAVALADVGTLLASPHNVGTLYRLPEVRQERYDAFHRDHAELQAAYARLGARVAGDDPGATAGVCRGELLIHLVEVVIEQRRTRVLTSEDAHTIAEACLLVCRATPATVAAARSWQERSAAAVSGRGEPALTRPPQPPAVVIESSDDSHPAL